MPKVIEGVYHVSGAQLDYRELHHHFREFGGRRIRITIEEIEVANEPETKRPATCGRCPLLMIKDTAPGRWSGECVYDKSIHFDRDESTCHFWNAPHQETLDWAKRERARNPHIKPFKYDKE